MNYSRTDWVLGSVCLMLIVSACIPHATVHKFSGEKTSAEGTVYRLYWNVENADSISIPGVATGLKPVGSLEVQPDATKTYFLEVFKNGKVQRRQFTAVVSKVSPPEEKQEIRPYFPRQVDIETSTRLNSYLSGMTTIDKVRAEGNKISYEILAVDQSTYPDSVKILLIAKDEYGNFVSGMAPPYIAKGEDYKDYFLSLTDSVAQSVGQKIATYSVREYHDEETPSLSIAMCLDHSGSMGLLVNDLQEAADNLARRKGPEDEIAVIKFASGVQVESVLDKSVNSVKRGSWFGWGATALYDAAYTGLHQLDSAQHQEVLILFTDGRDNASRIFPVAVVRRARAMGARIYTIGYGNVNEVLLRAIATYTNGKSYYARDMLEVSRIYEELRRTFRNYYVVTYTPPEKDGLHKIEIPCFAGKGYPDDTLRGTYYVGKDPELEGEQNTILALFDFVKSIVKPLYRERITNFVKQLRNPERVALLINGHTDQVDTDAYNDALSMRRAQSVKRELLKLGLLPHQLKCIPYGEREPRHPKEKTKEEAAENRRVEVEYLAENTRARECGFTVLLCEVSDEGLAQEIQSTLLNKHPSDEVFITISSGDGYTTYRVYSGCFESDEEAEKNVCAINKRINWLLKSMWSIVFKKEVVDYP